MAKKIYVLDTNVYLSDANSIESFNANDIVIPLKVLDEIDKHKKRQDPVGSHARNIIRKLDKLRESGNLSNGVRVAKGKGLVWVKSFDSSVLPSDLELANPDNQIIATALTEKNRNPDTKVILVSRDINMRVKCDSLDILCEDYNAEQVVEDISGLYTGTTEHLVDDQIIDSVYNDEEIYLDEQEIKLGNNQFVMLVSNFNEKKSALVRFLDYTRPVKKVENLKRKIWGLKPRNKEQTFALDLLMDPTVPVVTLIGKAGSGKTLLALAAALQQTFGETANDRIYNRIVVTKPVEPVGKDIGFLPGTRDEKMLPWLAPIQDNLQFLFGNDKMTLDMHIDEGRIEVEAMTYIRGRSICNSFIIIDEAQNMNRHEIKTVLTRVGEGTKIVLTGDIEQIDNIYIDSTNNGLSYLVEKFKDQEIAGHVTLLKGERSKVASVSARIL
ncbi:MAG: PhoH family protein [Candidatus Peribacter sp.]|nr:PhoH family protein [Candidatus Peribacter sp.]